MPIPGKREHQEGGTAGTKVEVGARHVASPKLVLSAFVSLLSPVRLVPPHSLQVVHIETHRCNITWTVSQVSHYIQNDVEFEARLRYADHSWEDARLLTLRQNQQWISLENLAPGMEYELQVRAKPRLGSHEVWSHWSQPLAFRMLPAVALRHMGSYRTRD
ncbi:PREDICTED: interleukin-2 receptor subunit beta-like isoform X2 [Bison bison bison]|uniref:Interleukin-2 receptor subunit beta-like isoform X2 n=1 Tax=Bison bison bison TaxID=43346 RepID=A0A6P3J2H2_BISBB|nr:PREDICTED: interleukin-2 receptor subunit beta-like isoform X2 [Bison bison bison]